jgi:peptidylprolyl isomerase
VAGASALLLASCGSSKAPGATVATPTSVATTTVPATTGASSPTSAGPALAIAPIPTADLSPAGAAGTAPTVVVPSGTPPSQLESADLIKGTGRQAEPGDTLTVQYVLATYSTRKVVQSSWGGQPFSFVLGEGQVIDGWDDGIVGMRAGGRRELIIPPSLGYGSTSPGPGISSNDTLIFVVDLTSVG